MTSPRIELPPRYRVLRHVATGGMASVYAAADEVLGREVAIKVLAEALGADESARARFTREARAAARVSDHPNVVTIYDTAETESEPPVAFIVMELVTGGTVNDRLKAGEPIPHTLALRWLEQIASALDAAHATGMVHRDVKPANLLLDAQGTLKVADFGIATLASEAPLTMTGQVVGTAAYFSPEQALGKPATAASDRYALAVVAYELLTGRRPFTAGAPAAQAMAHVEQPPPPATSLAPGLPDAVDAVLARGMAKEPDLRPATAAELVAELHSALGPTATTGVAHPAPAPTEPVQARVPRTPRPAAAAPPPPEPPRFERRPPPPAHPPRRSRAGIIAAIAALVLVAGAAIAAVSGGGGDSDPPARTTPATAAKKPAAKKKQPAAAATPAPEPTPEPAPAAEPSGIPADASAIQADAHQRLVAGDYDGAIGLLTPLVPDCPVAETDPCAYATYDLAMALLESGRAAESIPYFQRRLENPDQAGLVQSMLDRAEAEAAGTTDSPGKGNGKAKGRDKDDD